MLSYACTYSSFIALHKRSIDIKDLKAANPNPPVLNHTRPKYSPIQRRLKNQYIDFLVKVRRACLGVSFDDMKLICSQLLRDQARELPHGEARRKIERDLERLHNLVTSNEVLDCLATHADYIHCELIYELVMQLDNNELNKAWTAYSDKLKEACKLTLDRWSKSEVSGSPETGMLTLAFQTTLTPDSLPLERVLKLQGFLCHVLEMMETEFAGYASSTVTVFFTVCSSRLPFLLLSLSRHRKILEDLSIEFAFVPGEFIYSIPLDQDYEFLQVSSQFMDFYFAGLIFHGLWIFTVY